MTDGVNLLTVTDKPAPFQITAGHPALDFINTLDNRFADHGPTERLNAYGDLLRFGEQSKVLTWMEAEDLRRRVKDQAGRSALHLARHLRESMAAVFYKIVDGPDAPDGLHPPAHAQLQLLEHTAKSAFLARTLRWTGPAGENRLEWVLDCLTPELPLWRLALVGMKLMASDDLHRLRSCDDPDCRWLFWDATRNQGRRWCDMKVCGNRQKSRRHYARS